MYAAPPLIRYAAPEPPSLRSPRLTVHFDVDLVDFLDAPLAENTDRGAAPSLRACGEVLSALLRDERVRALTVTEFNPHHGSQDGDTTQRLLQVLIEVLGEPE
jgi:arginase